MRYKRVTRLPNHILRIEDNATIPLNEENADYKQYLLDIAAGAVLEPADPPPPIAQDDVDAAQIKADALTQTVVAMSLTEIGAYVDTNFSNLTVAQRRFIKFLAYMAWQGAKRL